MITAAGGKGPLSRGPRLSHLVDYLEMAWMPAASVTLPPPGRVKLISIFIVTALVLQFLAGVLRTVPWVSPFINYPMYATAHYEGDRISYEYTVYATFEDGSDGAFKS